MEKSRYAKRKKEKKKKSIHYFNTNLVFQSISRLIKIANRMYTGRDGGKKRDRESKSKIDYRNRSSVIGAPHRGHQGRTRGGNCVSKKSVFE